MENLEKLLKTIEKNYNDKDKREKVPFKCKDMEFEVLTFTRSEKADILFSWIDKKHDFKTVYEWFKPWIYKALQLKDLAMKAKEEGYIKTYYEVIDYLFNPEDIVYVINFILSLNNISNLPKEVNDLQKKQ